MRPKIKIVCLSKTNNMLSLVKLTKEFSGLGLRESKDVIDKLQTQNDFSEFEYERVVDNRFHIDLETFRRDINELPNAIYLVTCIGIEVEREHKLLSIGLGERQEYVNFLQVHMRMFKNFDEALKLAFSYLSDEELVKVISKLER